MFDAMLDHEPLDPGAVPSQCGDSSRRPRLLLLAYACSPFHGSEPGTGWNRAVQSARFCDTWVLCEKNEFAHHIEAYVEKHGPIVGLHFIFVDKTLLQRGLGRIPGLYYLSYNMWHRRAYHVARQAHAEHNFDLVHQANMCGYREPGYLWRLDAPFIWGPVGGTHNYPWRFLREASLKGAVSEILRNVLNTIQLNLSRRVRRAARRANAVLVANSTVRRDLESALGIETTTLVETGLPWRPRRAARRPDDRRPLRVLWSGIIVPRKALSLLIKALACLPDTVPYQLRILGEGSERRRCERLARDLGIDRYCTWLGWVSHEEALRQYDWADVFVFTSLRDTTGNVVLEALGYGVPVVCLDHQGVADIVDENSGIKVPVSTPREVIVGLSAAISKLARNPGLCQELGQGAVRRARHYEWPYLAERAVRIYREVLSECDRDDREVRAGQRPLCPAGRETHVLASNE